MQHDPSTENQNIPPRIRRAFTLGRLVSWVLPVIMILLIPAGVGAALGVTRKMRLVLIGLGTVFYAAYWLIGCKLHWDHMFFAIRLAHRVRDIPDEIDWSGISRLDTLAVPCMYAVLGAAVALVGLF